ncbi:hypothetical protein [Geodermatophilus sp. URMC 62]|uniref:hypothetical protein n=1 Tax=Geodermatophilus sp. URMC 62 TaxID=3423414 RepID=UPI00406C2C93
MTDTSWICTPAGVSGPGALAARAPQAGALGGVTPSVRPRRAVVRAMTPFALTGTGLAAAGVAVHGTGLPTAGLAATDVLGTGVLGAGFLGTAVIGTDVFGIGARTGVLRTTTDPKPTTSTTLGIPPPRRPQS